MALDLFDLKKFEATYNLYSGFNGSVELTNANMQYGIADNWTPIRVSCVSTVDSDLDDDSCLAGTINWLNGVVHSGEQMKDEHGRFIKFNVASYFSTLIHKSINTHFYSTTPGTIILDVLQVYCGVPITIFNLTLAAAPLIYSVVSGSNVFEECRKLAAVGQSDFFIQVGGLLTVEPWKDHNSAVDVDIPREVIIKTERIRSIEKGPTRIRVRGKHTSRFDCGQKMFSGGPGSPLGVTREKCYINGIGEPTSDLVLKNLGGSKEDLRNASYLLDGDLAFDVMSPESVQDSRVTIHTVPKVGTFLSPATISSPHNTEYKVVGFQKSHGEVQDFGKRAEPQKAHLQKHDMVLSNLIKAPPGVMSISNKDPHLGAESGDRNRYEMVINDVALQSQFGIVVEEADNQYVSDGYTAFVLGIRKIQEFLMGRNKYTVVCGYLPCIQINSVVTFYNPDSNSVYDTQVTGRVVNIHVDGNLDATSMTMTLEVESFEELAGRVYESGNLFIYPELCGINGRDWISTSGGVYALSGYFAFENSASVHQNLLVPSGFTYTLTFDVDIPTSGTMTVAQYNGATLGVSGTYSAPGSYSLVFIAITSDIRIVFSSAGETFLSVPDLRLIVTT